MTAKRILGSSLCVLALALACGDPESTDSPGSPVAGMPARDAGSGPIVTVGGEDDDGGPRSVLGLRACQPSTGLPEADPEAGSRDVAFSDAIGRAKGTCDGRFGSLRCGTISTLLGEDGCLQGLGGTLGTGTNGKAYLTCVLAELSLRCNACEASETRVFELGCDRGQR